MAAGREAFGYNRSVEGAQAARFDGFDATTDLTEALTRAADLGALIVLAVPMPALPGLLDPFSHAGPRLPAHRRHQRQRRGARRGDRGGPAGALRRGTPDDGHRALGLGGRACPAVHRRPMGDQRGRPCRPGGVVDGDAAGAGLRFVRGARPLRRARRRRGSHLASAAPARRGPGGHRRRGAAGVRTGRGLFPGRHPGGGQRAGSGAGHVRSECAPAAAASGPGYRTAQPKPESRWRTTTPSPSSSKVGMPPAPATTVSRGRRSSPCSSAPRIGVESWRPPVAPAG